MEELILSFEEVVRNLHFIPYIEQEILKAFSRKEKWIQEIAETAYSGTGYAFPLLKRRPFTRLLVLCYLLKTKFFDYQKLGASKEIIWDTFQDVSVRCNLTYQALAMQNKKRLGYAMGVIMIEPDVQGSPIFPGKNGILRTL